LQEALDFPEEHLSQAVRRRKPAAKEPAAKETIVLSIGDFSRITGLTVKALRFYHEQGVLTPTHVDEQTGYRYYAESKIETARVISRLRQLDFPVADIAEILRNHDDDADILEHLERHGAAVRDKMRGYQGVAAALAKVVAQEKEARTAMKNASFDVQENTAADMLIAFVRMKGKYSECGKGFAQIGRAFGRHICGKPFLLHYDCEYKEDDADFEACMPIKKGASTDQVAVRTLAGGRCVSLLHQGPYEELGRSYAKILDYLNQKGWQAELPTREVYIKGPGMIFKGNPKKYLTEIQMLIKTSAATGG
jgi:DNA-binding transcriptional MerR regulator